MVEVPTNNERRFKVQGSTDPYEVARDGILRMYEVDSNKPFAASLPLKPP